MKTITQEALKELIDSRIEELKTELNDAVKISGIISPSANQCSGAIDELRFLLETLDIFEQ